MSIRKIASIFCIIFATTFISCEEPSYEYTPNINIPSLGIPADNEIWFTTTDGLHLISIDESAFDAKISDIEYSDWGYDIIHFESKVTKIGDNAFNKCTNLQNISLPNSVRTIGDRSFYDCSNLECLTLGNNIKSIDSEAFGACYQLYSLHIPSIAAWCQISFSDIFSNPLYFTEHFCINDQSITILIIPNGIECINSYAFISNIYLEKVILPSSITSIGYNAFEGCSNIREVDIKDLERWCQIEFANETANPLSLSGVLSIDGIQASDISISNVSSVNSYAFIHCNSIKSFSADDALKKIGIDAFRDCSELASITLGNGITKIDENAFMGCRSLNNIVLPKNISSIGNNAFYGCTSLQNITIPNGITTIDNSLFRNCTGLQNITIPNSVISIGESAFENCTALQEITIPESVEAIERYVFKGCSALKYFYGKFASADNRALIIDNVLEVYAIGNANTEYNIPNEITRIEDSAFLQCKTLRKITIPDSVTAIGASAFRACSALTDITLPDHIKYIENTTFNQCSSLKVVNIPEGVTSIGKEAFKECSSLTDISLPDSITEIEEEAFKNCSSLASVTCKATIPPTLNGSYVFSENSANRKFYVPSESLDEYKKYSNWSRYADSIMAIQ